LESTQFKIFINKVFDIPRFGEGDEDALDLPGVALFI